MDVQHFTNQNHKFCLIKFTLKKNTTRISYGFVKIKSPKIITTRIRYGFVKKIIRYGKKKKWFDEIYDKILCTIYKFF